MRTLKLSSLLLLLATVCFSQDVPDAYRLSGHFKAESGSHDGKNVDLYFSTTTEYQVRIGDRWFRVTRNDETEDTMSGREIAGPSQGLSGSLTNPGANAVGNATLSITVEDVRNYTATLTDGGTSEDFTLERRILIPPADGESFDRGPRGHIARHLREAPAYPNTGDYETVFWDDWGPVFYRGRLNGKARVIGIASDPGPTESLPFIRRSLVGDAGQRTQGFLEKLGLTESYVLVNAYTYPTRPSRVTQGRKLMTDPNHPEQAEWRNTFYDLLYAKGGVEAIALFGEQARVAFNAWNQSRMDRGLTDLRDEVSVVFGAHPSSGRDEWGKRNLARGWRAAVEELRQVVTPDDPELAKQPNFGEELSEIDYAEIPSKDLPKGSQEFYWVRDNSWSRTKVTGRRNNSVRRHGRLNMEFNHLDGSTDFFRVTGRDMDKPNQTPDYETFNAVAGEPLQGQKALLSYVLNERFGANSIYTLKANELPNKTRIMNALKAADATWKSDTEVKTALDHLYRDVPGFTPQMPTGLGGN